MNSNKFTSLKIILILSTLLFFTLTDDTTENDDTTNVRRCNRKIQQSMGMKGLYYPEKSKLDMCPTIDYTCCTVEDQLKIYEFWVTGKEEENLEARLEFHRKVYSELFTKSIEVYSRAKTVMELLHDRSVSNCKVLARRIVNFRIDSLAPLLRTSIEHYHTFIKESYKGLYCSICDAENTKFIDISKSKFDINEEFCRDIIYNSLHVLIYLHSHFTKYLNLLSKFVTNCNYRGVYKRKTISGQYLFSTKADHHRMLGTCQKYRNDINWFDFCEPVCKQFSIVEFKDFFKPNVEKVRKYTRWIGNQLVKHRAAEAKDVLLNGDLIKARKNASKTKAVDGLEDFDIHSNKSRLLQGDANCKKDDKQNDNDKKGDGQASGLDDEEDEDTKKDRDDILAEEQQKFEEQLADAMMIKEKPEVFRSVAQSEIDYNSFHNRYGIEGLNIYSHGKTSQINENTYKSIKATVELERKKQVGAVLKKKQKDVKKWWSRENKSDEDSGIYRYSVSIVLVTIGFMMR